MSSAESIFELRDNKQLYAALGVSLTATDSEIKRAYHKLAIQYHPDKNPAGAEQFKEISFAHGILCDVEQRRMYDNKTLRNHVAGKARTYDPMMDPNVELTAAQLREFVERLRADQHLEASRQREFEQKRAGEMQRQEEFALNHPNFKMPCLPAASLHYPSLFHHPQRTSADMMRAIEELREQQCSSPVDDLDHLKPSQTSLKQKMLSEFRNSRRDSGVSTVEEVTIKKEVLATLDDNKFDFVKSSLLLPSYCATTKRMVEQRSKFDYRSFVEKDYVDGGVVGEAILADALGDYDPNN